MIRRMKTVPLHCRRLQAEANLALVSLLLDYGAAIDGVADRQLLYGALVRGPEQ